MPSLLLHKVRKRIGDETCHKSRSRPGTPHTEIVNDRRGPRNSSFDVPYLHGK